MTSEIAITGAAGHIGRTLICAIGPDQRIRAIDRAPRPPGIGSNVEWIRADVRDRATMTEALSGVETVVHLAAIITISPATAERAWDVNVSGAENTARAALDAGVSRFVHCSSIHAFDCTQGTGPLNATSPRSVAEHLPLYDRSKAAGEARVRAVHAEGLDVVVVHPAGVIGPGDHVPSLMGQMFRKIVEGTMPGVVATPFEWVDVRDVAAALKAATTGGKSGTSYLLSGHHLSVGRLTEMVALAAGVEPPRAYPLWLVSLAAKVLPLVPHPAVSGLVTRDAVAALRYARRVDDAPARADLGHVPRPIEETVADTVTWLLEGEPITRPQPPNHRAEPEAGAA